MDSEHSIRLDKWTIVLAFATGSVLTATLSMIEIVLLFWILQGTTTGAWIILGRSWKRVARDVRLRLGFTFLAIGWGGLAAIFLATPVGWLIVVATVIALAIVVTAYLYENSHRKQDEGEIFP